MTHVHVAIWCSWHVLVVIEFFVFLETWYFSLVLTISYDLIQMVKNVGSWACSSTCQTRFTSGRRNCVAHTSEEGCIEFAVTIMTIFGDLTIVNNDVGNDAEVPEHDRGHQHDRTPAWCQRPPEIQ